MNPRIGLGYLMVECNYDFRPNKIIVILKNGRSTAGLRKASGKNKCLDEAILRSGLYTAKETSMKIQIRGRVVDFQFSTTASRFCEILQVEESLSGSYGNEDQNETNFFCQLLGAIVPN